MAMKDLMAYPLGEHPQTAAVVPRVFPYRFTDGGRADSRRPKQQNDCTVVALAVVTGTPYDAMYDLLAQDGGRKSWRGFNVDRWIYGRIDPAIGEPEYIFGWTAERLSFPAVKGQRRMNPATFHTAFPAGRFMVRTAGHVHAVVDGVTLDTVAPDPDRCIYAAWRFTRVQP